MLDGQNGDEDTRQKKRMMQTYMTLFNVTNSSQQLGAFFAGKCGTDNDDDTQHSPVYGSFW